MSGKKLLPCWHCGGDAEVSYGVGDYDYDGGDRWRFYRARVTCRCGSELKVENYGGRGISVCDEWVNSFDSFASWALSNGYDENAPHGSCTLDRINPDDNYKPSNCRFADSFVQANNRRDRGLKDAPVLGADGIYHLGTEDGRCAQ